MTNILNRINILSKYKYIFIKYYITQKYYCMKTMLLFYFKQCELNSQYYVIKTNNVTPKNILFNRLKSNLYLYSINVRICSCLPFSSANLRNIQQMYCIGKSD